MDPVELELNDKPVVFKMFTGLLKTYRDADGKMALRGVASSTIKDRHGDEMRRSAIDDMVAAANQNLTIFLNHSYDVPEDVAGSVRNASAKLVGTNSDGAELWDLDYDVVINEANPRAVDSWKAIDGGTKLGLSIGAMIPEGGATRNKKTGAYAFDHVELLETSIVGIPANPRSWISSAVKAIKSLEPEPLDVTAFGDLSRSYIVTSIDNTTANTSDNVIVTLSDPVIAGEADPEVVLDSTPEITSSQEAPESEPETEPAAPEPVTASAADLATFTDTLGALEAAVNELTVARRQRSEANETRDAAIRQRDEAIELTNSVLLQASQIIERLASVPLARKAVIREVKDELSSVERMYGPNILKILRGTPNG